MKMHSVDFPIRDWRNVAIEEDGLDIPFTKITHCNDWNCQDRTNYKYPKLIKERRGDTIFHICPRCKGSYGSWKVK